MVKTNKALLWITGGLIALGLLSARTRANPDCPECEDCPDCPIPEPCPDCPEPEPCPPTTCPIIIKNEVQTIQFFPVFLWDPRMHYLRASIINTSDSIKQFWTEVYIKGNITGTLLKQYTDTRLRTLAPDEQTLLDVAPYPSGRFGVPPEDTKIVVDLYFYNTLGQQVGHDHEIVELFN